ncbi:MAG: hypothetical protein IJ419_08765 [Agathobacter sp.]|nr:hypothetical protein [Agathobacter sp.]
MKQRKVALLVVLTMLVCMLSACGSNAGGTQDTETSTSETTTDSATESETGSETESESETETESDDVIKVITIAEALELCGEEGNITEERYYIRGTVEKMINASYGNMVVKDETGSITVYGTYSADGSLKYSEMSEKAFEGDEVLLHCILQNYNGTKEVKNARLIEFKKGEITIDTSKYTDMSIADIRKAKEGTLAKVDGVVAAITYSNGMVPNGVILVDNTQSIYVYDANLAQQVSVGNTITILGSKTYWILEDEIKGAEKFGYKGCCQLDEVTLVSNDGKTSDYDKSWIKTNTVKAMMENPKKNDITSSIYKVNALVKKVEGKGFTNYYFFDIDGETGSYTYTQCNGNDFAWLDKFDGKICTVYLTALNAKSSSSECFYRFFPVEVVDEGYKFNKKNTAEHVVKYYGIDQFDTFYSGNPELELLTSISSDLLGFKNATLSYASDNTKVIDFKKSGDKVVMHCLSTGSATVTVTGSYDGKTYSDKVKISVEVKNVETYKYINVSDAAKANVGDEVTVKGIVGPSLVNRDGFYLIDDTGVIAVIMDTSIISTLDIGQEIILKGTRDRFHDPEKGGNSYGQTCISGCELVVNNYGKHDYSTKTFEKNFTLADFYKLDPTVDYSTKVYILKATVKVEETNYYTNIKLTDGSTTVSLYCSSANQYSFLKAYAGQEVTIEIAPCNWNNKKYYAGCVLAVYTDDGKIINSLNFND